MVVRVLGLLHRALQRYHRMAQILDMTVIPPLPLAEATVAVEEAFAAAWEGRSRLEPAEGASAA